MASSESAMLSNSHKTGNRMATYVNSEIVDRLKKEISQLKTSLEQSKKEIDTLKSENFALREAIKSPAHECVKDLGDEIIKPRSKIVKFVIDLNMENTNRILNITSDLERRYSQNTDLRDESSFQDEYPPQPNQIEKSNDLEIYPNLVRIGSSEQFTEASKTAKTFAETHKSAVYVIREGETWIILARECERLESDSDYSDYDYDPEDAKTNEEFIEEEESRYIEHEIMRPLRQEFSNFNESIYRSNEEGWFYED